MNENVISMVKGGNVIKGTAQRKYLKLVWAC